MHKTTVLVAGSWGTALAAVLAGDKCPVMLWCRNAMQAEEINHEHRNSRYLPDSLLPESIIATTSIEEAVTGAKAIVLAAPSSAMREVSRRIAPYIQPDTLIVHAAKGFEIGSLKRMSTVIEEEIPSAAERVVVLSGPSHAEEVIRKNPTTVVVASASKQAAVDAQDLFMRSHFRVYTNTDVIGVEVSGALKNVIALGTGLSDGLGYGDNAKAALITRGLAEISRLGLQMGANPLTFAGLAGVGDLVVTCTSQHSRNWRAGSMLAQGLDAEHVQQRMGMVVEGIKTTKAAYAMAQKLKVDMPITTQLYHVLFEGKEPREAVNDLMARDKTHEIE